MTGMINHVKLTLFNFATNIEVVHFKTPRLLPLDGFVANDNGGVVVAIDRDGQLGMAHLGEGKSHYFPLLDIEEQCA